MSFARAISLVFASLAFRRPIRVCLRCFPCRLVSPSCGALVLAGSACVAASCALPVGQGRAVGVHGCVGGQFCRCGQAARADPARLVWVNGLFMRSACTVAQAASSAGAAKLVASFYPLSSDSLKTSRNATFSPCPSLGRFEGSDISKRMKRAAPSPSLLRLGKKDIAPPHPPLIVALPPSLASSHWRVSSTFCSCFIEICLVGGRAVSMLQPRGSNRPGGDCR